MKTIEQLFLLNKTLCKKGGKEREKAFMLKSCCLLLFVGSESLVMISFVIVFSRKIRRFSSKDTKNTYIHFYLNRAIQIIPPSLPLNNPAEAWNINITSTLYKCYVWKQKYVFITLSFSSYFLLKSITIHEW